MGLDSLSNTARQEIEKIAAKHPSFASFVSEMESFADLVWHNVRRDGTQQAEQLGEEAVQDVKTDVSVAETSMENPPPAPTAPVQDTTAGTTGSVVEEVTPTGTTPTPEAPSENVPGTPVQH
ncbi:MAG TPA: hypothetical protein VGI71_23950 [Scandinavium sp.]|jgi:hypothetical protein